MTSRIASVALIREVETRAAEAWPAAEVQQCGGWLLRYAGGVTGRANSVWPNARSGDVSLEERLQAVEAFYQERGLPPRYQVCPASLPVDLDQVLARRGYTTDPRVCVQTADLSTILSDPGPRDRHVSISPAFDEEWFAAYCDAEKVSPDAASIRREILCRIAAPVGFAAVRCGHELASMGLGEVSGGWLGLFNIATRPRFRRRGLATAVLHELARWAAPLGAERSYLQVLEDNVAARAVYSRMGFSTLYRYHYRVGPPDGSMSVTKHI